MNIMITREPLANEGGFILIARWQADKTKQEAVDNEPIKTWPDQTIIPEVELRDLKGMAHCRGGQLRTDLKGLDKRLKKIFNLYQRKHR